MKRWLRWMGMVMVGLSAVAGQAQQGSSLAFQRAAHLRRGINLSMWYAQTADHSAARIESYTTPADFKLIKDLGFDHVRLSIDPEPLIESAHMGSLRADAIGRLDKTVQQVTAAGLNVILDIHPEEPWKVQLSKGTDGAERFFAFWQIFAGHFAATDPERVFFEILNEPTMEDLYRWEGVQARAIARVRSVAPRHTIIATASMYSKIDTLLAMEPVRDENVIYTFHQYDPMWFTHQGATWGVQGWVYLRGVPYPSSPDAVQGILGQEPDESVRLQVQRYGWDRWDASRVGAEIAAVAEWAQRRGVPLYCGEFGVYRAYARPAERATWISDTRTALESKHIGWAMWDYQADFGLVKKDGNATIVDQDIVRALGLKR